MKVTQLFLHAALFIPGIGSLTDNVTTGPKAKFPGLTMSVLEGGVGIKLMCMGKGAIVPWANVKLALVEE